MAIKNQTTKSNPGSFKIRKPISLLGLIKKVIKGIFIKHSDNSFKRVKYLLITYLLNYINQYRFLNKFFCNLCRKKVVMFLHTFNKDRILKNSICIYCNSRKRHRGLFEQYKIILKGFEDPQILHFAPEPVFYSLFKNYNYTTADLNLSDVDLNLNIENIEHHSNYFDLILCNHVLEHVENDYLALRELYRILKSEGVLVLTVPGNWKRDKIIEFSTINSNGHYRDYGLDFIYILQSEFEEVKVVDLYDYNKNYSLPLGLTKKHDLVFICQKK